ncbi:hypothetical protein KIH39_15545 [Telmatocola sphagniphila]|uniref:Hint domain-containing protein n=1 Tax=Telmatocola sphagniphila TaxID=1123043 RepID=A0A8E6B1V5_9BACT|nr:Hint domain-containing protein [Telmatocola sphagniphila]QVL30267.1 hypothetical protein KIH39_15545 [Telmatocola sphagniphila]
MLSDTAQSLVVNLAIQYGAPFFLKTVEFLAKSGWTVVRDQFGKIIRIEKNGIKITRAQFKDAATAQCFPAGTLVDAEFGLIKIEELNVGDKVWSFDHKNLEWKLKPILNTYILKFESGLASILAADEVIEATGGHPFWVVRGEFLENRPSPKVISPREIDGKLDGRWVLAEDLKPGDELYSRNKSKVNVESIIIRTQHLFVFNIQVEELENYAITSLGILVHNQNAIAGFEAYGVNPLPGTRIRPPGIPDGWRIRGTKSKGGIEYYNPNNPNESVRIMQGNPNSPYPNSQGPYVRQRDAGGNYLRPDGTRSPLPNGGNKDPDTHIPLERYPGFIQ